MRPGRHRVAVPRAARLGLGVALLALVGLLLAALFSPYRTLAPATGGSYSHAEATINAMAGAVDLAQTTGKPVTLHAVFTDAELTSLAERSPAPAMLHRLRLHATSQGYLEATARAWGLFPVYLQASVASIQGQPVVQVEEVRLGLVPLPALVASAINDSLAQMALLGSARLSGLTIRVRSGEVSLTGTAEP